MRKIILKSWFSPGDVVVSTVVFRELKLSYPDIFLDVVTPYPEIFYNNPRINKINPVINNEDIVYKIDSRAELLTSKYTGNHVSDGVVQNISTQLNLSIKKSSMFPEIFLTDEEKNLDIKEKYGIEGKYWTVNCGVKHDMPLKGWPISYWKELIYLCNKSNIQLIQVGSIKHIHPSFLDVKSLVGQTECLREYIKLCYFSEGSIGPVSLHMHLSASFRKPCIVLAGNRENPRWEMYHGQIYHSTIGLLDCCRYDGCWYKKREDCKNMVEMKDGTYYPKCLIMITPELIFDNLLQYSLLKD